MRRSATSSFGLRTTRRYATRSAAQHPGGDLHQQGRQGDAGAKAEAIQSAFANHPELIREFADADWTELENAWSARPVEWQCRLDETLPFGAAGRSIPVMAEMLAADDPDLVTTAADHLRDFGPEAASGALTPVTREKLANLAGERGGIAAGVIHELLKMKP